MKLINLKSIRNSAKRTQGEVASDLSIPLGTYRNWEQMKFCPKSRELEMLADYFDCTIDYLMGREEIEHTPANSLKVSVVPSASEIQKVKSRLNDEGKRQLHTYACMLARLPEYQTGQKQTRGGVIFHRLLHFAAIRRHKQAIKARLLPLISHFYSPQGSNTPPLWGDNTASGGAMPLPFVFRCPAVSAAG